MLHDKALDVDGMYVCVGMNSWRGGRREWCRGQERERETLQISQYDSERGGRACQYICVLMLLPLMSAVSLLVADIRCSIGALVRMWRYIFHCMAARPA
jgi:hypothetical protein